MREIKGFLLRHRNCASNVKKKIAMKPEMKINAAFF